MSQLAGDNDISSSTGYDYVHEGIDVLAAQAPSLHGALLATKAAGYSHVIIDGTLIAIDRVRTPGPTEGSTCGGRENPTTTWRQRAGRHRPGRLAAVEFQGAPRPRA